MKKVLSLVLTVVMVISLAACSLKPAGEDGPGSSSNQTSGENNGETNQGNSGTDKEGSQDAKAAKTLSDIYKVYEKMNDSMTELTYDVTEKSFEAGNSETDYIPFSPFILDFGNFVLAGSFGDLSLEIITEAFKYITGEDTVIDKIDNGYVVKFTATSGEKVTDTFNYNLDTKSVAYTETRDGELTSFFDMQNLGNGKYVLLSTSERGIVDFDGEKVTGYYISKLGSKAYRNDYSSATVYGKKNVEESWVTELQAENRVEKIWDLRQNNKLVVSTLLKSSYNDSGEIVYEVNNPIKEQVFQY